MATSDDAEIDLRQLRLGEITYSVAVFPSGDTFVTAWRCPVCERRQGCHYRTATHLEAVDCAEAEVHKHHAEYHPDSA